MRAQGGDFDIVKADLSHLNELVDLFDAYRVFYEQPSDPKAARRFIEERLRLGDSVVFLARRRAAGAIEPQGFTQLYPAYSSVSMKRLWILNDLFVHERGRRSGVALALIDRAKQLAIDTGAKGLILETAIDNREAQALYDKTGFARDTEFYRYHLEV